MTVQHQSHQERIEAELSFEWDHLPSAVTSPIEISKDAKDARLLRKGKSLRGISSFIGLRRIWAYSVDQELLEELCCLSELEVLFIDRVSAVDLSQLDRLTKLRALSIENAQKINDLSWLPKLKSLRSLGLCDLESLHDLSELANQVQLSSIAIDGGVLRPMRVTSLIPLSSLKNLQFISLVNCRVSDESLQPLCGLRKLKALHCARFFPRSQFQTLHASLPALRCDWFSSDAWLENDG
jgi:hypothetical protein